MWLVLRRTMRWIERTYEPKWGDFVSTQCRECFFSTIFVFRGAGTHAWKRGERGGWSARSPATRARTARQCFLASVSLRSDRSCPQSEQSGATHPTRPARIEGRVGRRRRRRVSRESGFFLAHAHRAGADIHGHSHIFGFSRSCAGKAARTRRARLHCRSISVVIYTSSLSIFCSSPPPLSPWQLHD